jgi:hypothetical protein
MRLHSTNDYLRSLPAYGGLRGSECPEAKVHESGMRFFEKEVSEASIQFSNVTK